MAQSTPQQALNKQINLQVKGAFVAAQRELEFIVRNKILELKSRLMDPAFIFEKLSSFLCNPKIMEKIHNTFDKILRFLERNLLGPVGDVRDFVQKIMDKILKIRDKVLDKITSVLNKLQETIDPLGIVLRIAPIALKALSGPAANGGLIHDLSVAIRKAKGFIADIFNLVSDISTKVMKYANKCFKFIGIIGQVLTMINNLYDQIDKLIQYAKFLLLAYEGFCVIEEGTGGNPGGDDENGGDGTPPIIELSADMVLNKIDSGTNVADALTTAYQQLLDTYSQSGETKKQERWFKLKDTFMQKYTDSGYTATPTSDDIEYMTHYRVKLITQYTQE